MMRTYVKGIIPNSADLSDRLYISDLDKVSPGIEGFLSDREVRAMILNFRLTEDQTVRKEFVHTFGRYVVSIAKNYQNQGLPLCDLISEGMIGLMTALDNFDLNNETQFMTYANVVISRCMREALDLTNLPVKVPKNIRNQQRKVKSITEFMQMTGQAEELIQDRFCENEIDLECYCNPGLFSKVNVGLSSIEEDNDTDIESYFVSTDSPDSRLMRQDLKKDVARVLKQRLTKTEAKILRLFFGIDQPYRIVSTADLGARCNMSGERARQLKESGLQKLRDDECRKILIKYL
jgi:RNA polymerase primary sigma factor